MLFFSTLIFIFHTSRFVVLVNSKKLNCTLLLQSFSPPQKMGTTQICTCCHKYRHIIIYCLIILFAASTSIFNNIVFMAEGRAITNLNEVTQKGMKERRMVMVVKAQIGSKPPKCEGRCRTCGHCEAVQVPVEPIFQRHRSHYSTRATTYSSRSDDFSNYKPMSWKCKCGNYFFNP